MQFVGKSSPPMTFRLLILTALKRWSIRRFLLLAMAVPTLPGRRTGSTPSGIVTETGSGSSGGSGKISAWLRSATAAIVSRPSVNLASNRDPAGGLSGAENRRTVGSQSAPIGGTPTGGGRDHSASQTAQEIELRNCRSNRMCTDIFMPIKPAPSEAGGPDFVEGSGGRANTCRFGAPGISAARRRFRTFLRSPGNGRVRPHSGHWLPRGFRTGHLS